MSTSGDRGSLRRWFGGEVATHGRWVEPTGRERAFTGTVTLWPRFRPYLAAVVREGRAGTATHVRANQVRGLHLRTPRRDLATPGTSCSCPASVGRPTAHAVTLCLEDGTQLRLQGVDGVDFAMHVEGVWPRASLRLAGTFF